MTVQVLVLPGPPGIALFFQCSCLGPSIATLRLEWSRQPPCCCACCCRGRGRHPALDLKNPSTVQARVMKLGPRRGLTGFRVGAGFCLYLIPNRLVCVCVWRLLPAYKLKQTPYHAGTSKRLPRSPEALMPEKTTGADSWKTPVS